MRKPIVAIIAMLLIPASLAHGGPEMAQGGPDYGTPATQPATQRIESDSVGGGKRPVRSYTWLAVKEALKKNGLRLTALDPCPDANSAGSCLKRAGMRKHRIKRPSLAPDYHRGKVVYKKSKNGHIEYYNSDPFVWGAPLPWKR